MHRGPIPVQSGNPLVPSSCSSELPVASPTFLSTDVLDRTPRTKPQSIITTVNRSGACALLHAIKPRGRGSPAASDSDLQCWYFQRSPSTLCHDISSSLSQTLCATCRGAGRSHMLRHLPTFHAIRSTAEIDRGVNSIFPLILRI